MEERQRQSDATPEEDRSSPVRETAAAPEAPASLPSVSVIIPVHNGSRYLDACLGAVGGSAHPPLEVLLVDDASSDGSGEKARRPGVQVLRLVKHGGAAAARNHGARCARGEILLFLDSDVVIRPDTVSRILRGFVSDPGRAAVFGSYDDSPPSANFCSQYKNLLHHFVHQNASPSASTFWTGCGAIRRDAFEEAGGFDEAWAYMEDIELGIRLHRRGFRIMLDRKLQVRHLKSWTALSLFYSDVFCRAVPWSRLCLHNDGPINDLNLKISDRIRAVLAACAVLLFLLPLLDSRWAFLPALTLLLLLASHWKLYRFFARKRGPAFALLALLWQQFYYLYSGITYLACWAEKRLRSGAPLPGQNGIRGPG